MSKEIQINLRTEHTKIGLSIVATHIILNWSVVPTTTISDNPSSYLIGAKHCPVSKVLIQSQTKLMENLNQKFSEK